MTNSPSSTQTRTKPTTYTAHDYLRDNIIYRGATPHSLLDGCCHYTKLKGSIQPIRCANDAVNLVEGWGLCEKHTKSAHKALEPFMAEMKKLDMWNEVSLSMPSSNPVPVIGAIGEK